MEGKDNFCEKIKLNELNKMRCGPVITWEDFSVPAMIIGWRGENCG